MAFRHRFDRYKIALGFLSLIPIAIWLVVIYVAVHFILKYW
jgi:hypothetical protein